MNALRRRRHAYACLHALIAWETCHERIILLDEVTADAAWPHKMHAC